MDLSKLKKRMKAETLDMSLDDIIKKNRSSRPARASWRHNDRRSRDRMRPVQFRRSYRPRQRWTLLVLTNVHYEVDRNDIQKLLEKLDAAANVRKVSIKYDRSGRSEGICHVFYSDPGSARTACSALDSVELDGMVISASIADTPTQERHSEAGMELE